MIDTEVNVSLLPPIRTGKHVPKVDLIQKSITGIYASFLSGFRSLVVAKYVFIASTENYLEYQIDEQGS